MLLALPVLCSLMSSGPVRATNVMAWDGVNNPLHAMACKRRWSGCSALQWIQGSWVYRVCKLLIKILIKLIFQTDRTSEEGKLDPGLRSINASLTNQF